MKTLYIKGIRAQLYNNENKPRYIVVATSYNGARCKEQFKRIIKFKWLFRGQVKQRIKFNMPKMSKDFIELSSLQYLYVSHLKVFDVL